MKILVISDLIKRNVNKIVLNKVNKDFEVFMVIEKVLIFLKVKCESFEDEDMFCKNIKVRDGEGIMEG